MIFETVEWHHGGAWGSCSSDGPTPVSKLGKKRLRYTPEYNGKGGVKRKGKPGIYADCPKCGQWIRIGWTGAL